MPNVSDIPKYFTNPYPNGWKDYPDESTMITASSLQAHTDAIDGVDADFNDTRKVFCSGYTTDLGATINKFIYFGDLSATVADTSTMGEVLGRSNIGKNIIFSEFNECSPFVLNNCIIDSNQNFIIRQTPIEHCFIMASNTVFKDSQGKSFGFILGDHIINGGYSAGFINFILGTGHDLSQRPTSYWGPSFAPRSSEDEYGNSVYYRSLGSMVTGHFSNLNFNRVSRQEGGVGWPLLVIGNGLGESSRSNALELDNYGDMRIAGDLYFSTIGSLLTKINELEARIAALEGGT